MWALLVDDDLATVRTLRAEIDWQKFGFADARVRRAEGWVAMCVRRPL